MQRLIPILILISWHASFHSTAQSKGCTDPMADNYRPTAVINDGSCTYSPFTLSPDSSWRIPDSLSETSGLIIWNGYLWTHNDSDDNRLYALSNNQISDTVTLSGAINTDWEEITQDSNYIYIGDFGNNQDGNRQDLHILRISKISILEKHPMIDTIGFNYCDQIDFSSTGPSNTDFDCEAFVAKGDSLYLFTKQWVGLRTAVYSLPKNPGSYQAMKKQVININGLVTGATSLQNKNLIVLCGYNSLLQPFIYLIYDFPSHDFSLGNQRRIVLNLPFHQVEGITTDNGLTYFISNEYFSRPPYIDSKPQIHLFNLDSLLGPFLLPELYLKDPITIYPVPANDLIYLHAAKPFSDMRYHIINQNGQTMISGTIQSNNDPIDITSLSDGLYILQLGKGSQFNFKVIKR